MILWDMNSQHMDSMEGLGCSRCHQWGICCLNSPSRSQTSAHSMPEAIDKADGTMMMSEPCAGLCCVQNEATSDSTYTSFWGTQNCELHSEGKITWWWCGKTEPAWVLTESLRVQSENVKDTCTQWFQNMLYPSSIFRDNRELGRAVRRQVWLPVLNSNLTTHS